MHRGRNKAVTRGAEMKVGMNMLAVGGSIIPTTTLAFSSLPRPPDSTGWRFPVFGGEIKEYTALGRALDSIGLLRTAVTIIPDEAHSPVSPIRRRARAPATGSIGRSIASRHSAAR